MVYASHFQWAATSHSALGEIWSGRPPDAPTLRHGIFFAAALGTSIELKNKPHIYPLSC